METANLTQYIIYTKIIFIKHMLWLCNKLWDKYENINSLAFCFKPLLFLIVISYQNEILYYTFNALRPVLIQYTFNLKIKIKKMYSSIVTFTFCYGTFIK